MLVEKGKSQEPGRLFPWKLHACTQRVRGVPLRAGFPAGTLNLNEFTFAKPSYWRTGPRLVSVCPCRHQQAHTQSAIEDKQTGLSLRRGRIQSSVFICLTWCSLADDALRVKISQEKGNLCCKWLYLFFLVLFSSDFITFKSPFKLILIWKLFLLARNEINSDTSTYIFMS